MLKQLSIYAENKKGTLKSITGILQRENINILGSVTNDSAEYGIVRAVVSAPEKAAEALTEEGYLCRLTDVVGVEVADEVGNLHQLLTSLSESNISVDYVYLSFNRDSGKPILIFHADDIYTVEACLVSKGFTVVNGVRA
ncbi:MAG: amino acid-binding protein [Eubacteriales bacterium]|nr:amino acid-binding protein [Eubacteriales bacterium]